jgi:hypothetical protein
MRLTDGIESRNALHWSSATGFERIVRTSLRSRVPVPTTQWEMCSIVSATIERGAS